MCACACVCPGSPREKGFQDPRGKDEADRCNKRKVCCATGFNNAKLSVSLERALLVERGR